MTDTTRRIIHVLGVTIAGIFLSIFVTYLGGLVIRYIARGDTSVFDFGLLILVGLFGGVSGFLSGLAIALSRCHPVFGTLIGFFFHGFVILAPLALLGGSMKDGFSNSGAASLASLFVLLLCGGFSGLLLSILARQTDRRAE